MLSSERKQTQQKIREIIILPCFTLMIITIVGGLIRFYHLGYKPFWLDEAVIYKIANGPNINAIITSNAQRNSAPPLYVFLVGFINIFGDSETTLRLVSWLPGTASIPAIYYLSRQFIKRFPAYITAFFVAISPSLIAYSQELREYSLTFLLATVILLFFIRYIKVRSFSNWIFMTLTMIAGVFTQYGLSLLILSINIVYLIELIRSNENRKQKFLHWSGSQILILISILFVIYLSLGEQMTFGFGSSSEVNYLSNSYWSGSIQELLNFSFKKTYALFTFSHPGSTFLFLCIVGFLFVITNKDLWLPLALFIVPIGITWSLSLIGLYPYDGKRQLIFLTPMIFLISGIGINHLMSVSKNNWAILILCLFPIISGGISSKNFLQNPGKEEIRPVVDQIKQSYKDGDVIYVYYAAEPAFSYYYRENQSAIIRGVYSRGEPTKYFEQIDDIVDQPNDIWLVFSHCSRNECDLIPEYLSRFRPVELMVKENDAYLYFAGKDGID